MKIINFVLIYCFMLLFCAILGQQTLNKSKDALGEGFWCNNQRKFPEADYQSYITITYREKINYDHGFLCYDGYEYRNEISYIIYKNKRNEADKHLTFLDNTPVQLHFNKSIKSLRRFFDSYWCDEKSKKINSVDLSHFDSSLLESSDSMFYGCTSLESIDLSNFNAPLLANMNNMFFQCNSLKIIDLSKLNSSSLTNINRMFCGCASLEYINLNGLDFSKVEDASYMFYNVKNLKFINIYDVNHNDIFLNAINNISELNNNNIVVWQKENLIINSNFNKFDYNIEINEYECQNYISVYYKEETDYETGFFVNGIDSRNDILFIINENNLYYTNEKLNINYHSPIKLCMKNYVTSLENFFDTNIDEKAQAIISIDLSHFDSSLVTNVNNLFNGCQELLALDMSI